MAATGAMSAVANCASRARFGSDEWRQVAASQGNGGNAIVLAGLSQWGAMFADMIAYPINTEGQGARATEGGMDAYGFPWCAFGRAPDVESMENEFPMIIPFSSHWKDSGGTGYGDPLDRDPALVERDVTKNLVSAEVARRVYGVIFDGRTGRVDATATRSERARQVADRLSRGRPFEEFCEQWSQRKPPDEILEFFGSWPDGAVVNPLIRM